MTPLGRFDVVAAPAEVAAFRAATGLPPGHAVPATFAMRWLAASQVREALLALAPETGIVPVHESQTFDHLRPLNAGETYHMCLEARRDSGPDRVVLTGTIVGPEGDVAVRLETILRLFSTAAAAA